MGDRMAFGRLVPHFLIEVIIKWQLYRQVDLSIDAVCGNGNIIDRRLQFGSQIQAEVTRALFDNSN